MNKIGGIYQIKNLIDGKVYDGATKNIPKRWNKHKNQLINNCHPNSHLQAAWNKYGEHCFEFIVLEEISDLTKENLDKKEKYYINLHDATNPEKGYNKTDKPNSIFITTPQKTKRNKLPSHIQPDAIAKYYLDNHTILECAKFFEISTDSVIKILRPKGIIRNRKESHRVRDLVHPEYALQVGFLNKGKLVGENNPNFGKPGYWTGKTIPVEIHEKGVQTRLSKHNGSYFSEEGYKVVSEILEKGRK